MEKIITDILEKALTILPEVIRAEYLGIAWLKWQEIKHLPDETIIKKIRSHVRYLYRHDKRQTLLYEIEVSDTEYQTIDIGDYIDAQTNTRDRAILDGLSSGHTYREIGKAIGVSKDTIGRRVKAIRERLEYENQKP